MPRRAAEARPALPQSEWMDAEDEALLELRLYELDLRIEGSGLEERIAELGTRARGQGPPASARTSGSPTSGSAPTACPGIAIPFYLAHPRLRRLELTQMLEIEGGTREWCMMILRHEAGHAIENAYRLRRRPEAAGALRQELGALPRAATRPSPTAAASSLHLDSWYAQSHPDEDFAETFAVWLTPGSNWRERYAGWPALRKLEYVDELMREIAGRPPLVATRRTPFSLASPAAHAARALPPQAPPLPRRRARLPRPRPARAVLGTRPSTRRTCPPRRFLTRIRREVRRRVRRWTGERLST